MFPDAYNQTEADANFGDRDSVESEITNLEFVVEIGLGVLAEMATCASPETSSDMSKSVVTSLSRHFQNLSNVSKLNVRAFDRFVTGSLFSVLKIVLEESGVVLDIYLVTDVLHLIRQVARLTLHANKREKYSFNPASCSLIMGSLSQLLRHVVPGDPSGHDDDDVVSLRNNFVLLVRAFVKMQTDLSFQLYSLDVETQLVSMLKLIFFVIIADEI